MSGVSDPDDSSETGLVATIVPDPIRRSFALKFVLVLFLMGLIVVAVGLTATQLLTAQVEQTVEDEHRQLANQQATTVETWLQRNAVSVRLSSQNDAWSLPKERAASLKTARTDTWTVMFGVDQLHLVERTGNGTFRAIESATIDRGETLASANRGWVAERVPNNMPDSSVAMSSVYRTGDRYVIGFVSPVRFTSDRYLVAEFGVDGLRKSLAKVGAGQNQSAQFTQIVGGDGIVQAATSTSEIGTVYASGAGSNPIQCVLEHPGVGGTCFEARMGPNDVYDGTYTVATAQVTVEGLTDDWVVAVHTPTEEAFAFVTTLRKLGFLATIVGFVLFGIVGAGLGLSITRSIDQLRAKAVEMEQGNLDVTIETDRIDAIGQLYGSLDSMREALSIQIDEAQQARKEAEVSRAEAMEMNQYLQRKAEEYSETMERCAAGDLTQRMEPDGENESMDRIASSFNGMIAELEKTTGQLATFADEVETSGEVVYESAANVREASEQAADSIQQISADTDDQIDRLEAVQDDLEAAIESLETVDAEADLSDSIENLRTIADAIDEILDLAEDTLEESETVSGAAEEQAAELSEVSQRAEDLTRYARPLDDVLNRFETDSEHEFYFPTGPGASDDEE
ncbi:MAG: HAMP domain-containing protein [Halococcoides sp.]